jgi:hypothetical protein
MKTVFALIMLAAVAGEAEWMHSPPYVDDLTGETNAASLTVRDTEKLERAKSLLLLTHNKEGTLAAVIGLSAIDRFPAAFGKKEVSLSYRADGGELQKETKWKPDGPRTVFREVTPDEARGLFSGDFIIVAVDQSGKRYRYEFGDREGLMEAVESVIEAANEASK